MNEVNAYGSSAPPAATRSGFGSGATSGSGSDGLGINDFMRLLAAQLSNQDVMNPMQDTDFIAQMAQFTSLQAMQTMSEISYAQYGSSMIGKYVSVAAYDDMGNYTEDKGLVTSVKLANGNCYLEVNGKEYTMSSVMEILNEIKPDPPIDPPIDPPTDGDGEKE